MALNTFSRVSAFTLGALANTLDTVDIDTFASSEISFSFILSFMSSSIQYT
ncbi:hypothetical protein SDC9_165273 [bioreactor metagenome]|uniref:Uncharacterized protein n=1 Tax=bioreactor metagenome TaxID=1076179 RepID=A0A645FVR6_9ZZZZ